MNFICPECKNDVVLKTPGIKKGQIIECEMCGISLMVTTIDGDTIAVEIADEGK